MSVRTIKTRLALRRDVESAFPADFIPLKGEVLLVDTTSDGLRSKIGDGVTPYSNLVYTDQQSASGIVVQGYYYNNKFYTTQDHAITITPYSYKIYIDLTDYSVYGYFAENAEYHKLNDVSPADSDTPGVMKLYNTTGSNDDGTMTQHSITTELRKKFIVSVGEDENLIFSNAN